MTWLVVVSMAVMAGLFLWGVHRASNRIARLEIDVAQLRFVAWHSSRSCPPICEEEPET